MDSIQSTLNKASQGCLIGSITKVDEVGYMVCLCQALEGSQQGEYLEEQNWVAYLRTRLRSGNTWKLLNS